MITEKDLLEAIDECQREPITGTKIGKLADLMTIHHYMYGEQEPRAEAADKPAEIALSVRGDSEFMRAIDGKQADKVWRVLDELMTTLEVINPRMYDGVMRRLDE